MMRLVQAMAGTLLLLAACSPGSAEKSAGAAPTGAARHPQSGLAVIPLTITSHGKAHGFKVELAASPAEQEHGLMFRTAMGPDEGMIFPMKPPRMAAFWMKNTVISLDIIYIGSDGRVLNVAANAVPYSEEPLLSEGTAKGVLELNAGRAAELGIAAGDKVDW